MALTKKKQPFIVPLVVNNKHSNTNKNEQSHPKTSA